MCAYEVDYRFEDENRHDLLGCFLSFRKKIIIYLNNITTPSELYDTIEHEALHGCMFEEDLMEDEEEKAITAVQWSKEW